MIWANVTKFGQNFIVPKFFLFGTPMKSELVITFFNYFQVKLLAEPKLG